MPCLLLLAAAGILGACSQGGPAGPSEPSPSPTPSASAPSFTDRAFDQAVLHEVRIVMDPRDWQALRDNFRTNQYYAANIAIDGELVQQIGIRSRGEGSRDATKPGLRLDFNRFVRTQDFHGYKTMVLDNLHQDPALMRERLAFAVFEAMGIAAPQLAHARLFVNDEYWGLYTLVESVSRRFLGNRLGQDTGNLFDYEYAFDWDFSYRGPEATAYVPIPFQPQTNEDNLDPTRLIAFFRTITEAPDESFLREVSALLDTQGFLTYLAVENALGESDGMVGRFGVNNFYLYEYGGQNRFVFIPWDKESCLMDAHWPILEGIERNVLSRRLLADPAHQRTYLDALRRAAVSFVNTRWLLPRLEQAYAQVRQAALADTKKPVSNDEFERGVAALRGVIAAREADVLAQLPAR